MTSAEERSCRYAAAACLKTNPFAMARTATTLSMKQSLLLCHRRSKVFTNYSKTGRKHLCFCPFFLFSRQRCCQWQSIKMQL